MPTDITIRIKADDSASDKVKEFAAALGHTEKEAKKASSSVLDMAKSVFTANAAYDAAKYAIGFVGGLLASTARESIEASTAMAMVANEVRNAGQSFDVIGPKLGEYSAAMVKMGFDDEATSLSVASLLNVTNDYTLALELNRAAMDLARNKGIDLATATDVVQKAITGGAGVLKSYGIELEETAGAAEILEALQKRVAGSAEEFAGTPAGSVAMYRETWGNLKQEVGDRVVPAFGNLAVALTTTAVTGGDAASAAAVIGSALRDVVAFAASATNQLVQFTSAVRAFIVSGQKKSIANPFGLTDEEFEKKMTDIGDLSRASEEAFQKFIDLETGVSEGAEKSSKSVVELSDDLKKLLAGMGGGGSAGAAAKKNAEQFASAMQRMKEDGRRTFGDLKQVVADFNASSARNLAAFDRSVADIRRKMTELTDSFTSAGSERQEENNRRQLEIYNEHAANVERLRKELSQASDDRRLIEIQNSLNEEQQLLMRYSSLSEAAKQLTAKDDFELLKEKYDKEVSKAKEAYDRQMAELQRNMDEEKQAYERQKQDLIASTADKFAKIEAATAEGYDRLIETTELKLAQLKALEEQLRAITAGITGAQNLIGVNPSQGTLAAVPKFGDGGIVTRPTLALIGEKGPEAIVPLRGASAGSVGGVGGASAVTVQLFSNSNVSIAKEADERRLTDNIIREVSRVLQAQRSGLATSR